MYERGRHSMPRYQRNRGQISGDVMAVTNRFWNALPLLIVAASASAAYPDRPLRYVLGSAAGGGPDVAARVIMAELSRQTGQQVIVDNRPGASGVLGTELIARATPDGYTMGHGNINTMAINRSVIPNLPYDADRDLKGVVLMYNSPNLLAVTLSL